MATRDELYARFGVTAEAAQLFETELGTILLCVHALENGWHEEPDGQAARKILNGIDRNTLGGLLGNLRKYISLGDDLTERFASALAARNRLTHGFYEKHNFRIQSEQGRDDMIADLETLHVELFEAWQMASAMSDAMTSIILDANAAKSEPQ